MGNNNSVQQPQPQDGNADQRQPVEENERERRQPVRRRRASVRSIEDKEKKETCQCCACGDELPRDHGGLKCLQGHHLCLNGCADQYMKTIIAEPTIYLPPKCPACKVEYNANMFDRISVQSTVEIFHLLMFEHVWSKTTLNKGECISRCPHCKYFEIREVPEAEITFVYCKKPECKKITCNICKAEVNIEADDLSHSENDDEDTSSTRFHFKCLQLRSAKLSVEKAIELGKGVPCPGCGIIGRKDDACAHMTCENCLMEWCYVCGKKMEELNMEEPGNIYSHFRDWAENSLRCPMYFHEINNVDNRYPDDDHQALELFHERRSLLLLKDVYNTLGENVFNNVWQHFATVKNCGFSKRAIINIESPLFKRACNNRRNGCLIS